MYKVSLRLSFVFKTIFFLFFICSFLQARDKTGGVPQIPLTVLFSNPEKTHPMISPDGNQLAYCAPVDGVLNVWVKTLGKDDDHAVTHQTRRGVPSYCWAPNSKQILYKQDNDGDENYHLYSVDLEKNSIRDLTPFQGVKADIIAQDKHFPNEILVMMNKENPRLFDAYHLDLVTGALTLVAKNPGEVVLWGADAQLQVRAAIATHADGTQSLLVRDQGCSEWRSLVQVDFNDTFKDELHCGILGFSRDGKSLYLNSTLETNTRSLLSIDLETGNRTILATDEIYDVIQVLFNKDTYEPETVWWEKERLEFQLLDSSLKQDFQRLCAISDGVLCYVQKTADATKWVVCFMHDNKSHEAYLYDCMSKQVTFLFRARPVLNQYQLAEMKPISFVSRDGLTIHGYLSCPQGQEPENLPLVLYVHGGPFSRDTWGYNPTTQWLTNRGYACLEVNFRGSSGYGKEFLAAGNGEWGRKMHDDLIDAVGWAVDQKIADPARVAIYGGSYGGYSALVGATFTPDVFCCAIDYVGPSSLLTFLKTMPPYWSRAQWEKRIGSLDDEELIKSRSPLYHLDRIKIPIFIAHGANDVRIKQSESEQIVEAMKQKGLAYEYLLFPDEGHGFARPENRMIFFAAVEKFLACYL